jgi:DnaK suppressor protein
MVKKTTGKQKKIMPARTAHTNTAAKAMKKTLKTAAASKKVAKTAGIQKPATAKTAAKAAKMSPKTKVKTARKTPSSRAKIAARQVRPDGSSRAVKSVNTPAPAKTSAMKPQTAEKKKLSRRERMFLEIRKKLLQQKFDLLSEAEEALNVLPGQTMFPDLGDQASAEIDRNFMLRLRGREQRLLKKIEEAIEKIDTGAFGVCDVCGQEIDIKRLDARPVTNMCILCKTEQEEEEKARGI